MFKRFSANYMALLLLLDAIGLQLAFTLATAPSPLAPVASDWGPWSMPGLRVALAVIWLLGFLLAAVYTPRRIIRWYNEYIRLGLAHTGAALAFAGVLYLAVVPLPRTAFLAFYLWALVFLLGYRSVLRYWHRLRRHARRSAIRVLLVGAGDLGRRLVEELRHVEWPTVEPVGFLDDDPAKQGQAIAGLPVLGTLDDAERVVIGHQVDELLIALPPRAYRRMVELVNALDFYPVQIRVVPDAISLAHPAPDVERLGSIPLIGLRRSAIDGTQRLVKRLMDLVLSSLVLLVASPIMLLVALAIKVEDGGPVFYRSPRVGENGRVFHMLKFRSMVVGADALLPEITALDPNGRLLHKHRNDPRVTRVGRFIRRTSLDELPQLFNVLRGEMSLVGPRPELPWMVEKYEPWQRKRFTVPQGMTGWWQINGRSDRPMHLHTEDDLYYIQHYSLWLDLYILWRTLFTVIRGQGAY